MSASDTNNPSLPSRVRIKDIRILSAAELSKKLDVWLDGEFFEEMALIWEMEPDKAWKMTDDAAVSKVLKIQPYLHRSAFQCGAKKEAVSIQINADELWTAIGNFTSRIEYSRSEPGGITFIIGMEPDNVVGDQMSCSRIVIKNIKLNGVKLKDKIHMRLMVDNAMRGTQITHDGSQMEHFHFDAWSHSILEIQIFEHHTVCKTKLLGRIRQTVKQLLVNSPDEIPLIPFKYNPSSSEGFSLILAVESLSEERPAEERQAQEALKQAQQAAATSSPSPLVSSVTQGAKLVQKVSSIEFITDVLSIIIEKVDALSEIHPYAKMVWTILSAILKAYLNNQSRLQQLQGLLQVASDNYAFVKKAIILNDYDISSHQKMTITQIVHQTTECAYFIHGYLLSNGFVSHQIKNLTSDVQAKIDKYQETFEALAQQFHQEAALQIEISVFHTVNMLADLTAEHLLNDLVYAPSARFDFDKLCLSGTRVKIIDEIINWVNQTNNDDNTASRVYILTGGVSRIAPFLSAFFSAIKASRRSCAPAAPSHVHFPT